MTRKHECQDPPLPRTRVPPYRSTGISFDPDTNRTKQAMKDECDINVIMAKYLKTGIINHVASYQGDYGDYDAIDFQEAQEILMAGQQMFGQLPAAVRKEFQNDPAQFMSFCSNPENKIRMIELGLTNETLEEIEIKDVPRGTHNRRETDKEEKT